MGSTSTHRPSHQSTRDFVAELFDGSQYEVLDIAIVERLTAYVAARNTKTGLTQAIVILLGHCPTSYYNIWFKEIGEESGPNESECPRRILDLLSPVEDLFGPVTDDGVARWAFDWRARCQARLAHRETVKATVKAGTTVRFARPIRYGDGSEHTELIWTGKGGLFTVPGTGGYRVRVRSWRDRVTVTA